jgi:hypothetical protein
MNSALAKIERLEEKIEYWETRNFESNAGMTSQMFSGKQKIEDISTEQKILNMRIADLDGQQILQGREISRLQQVPDSIQKP